MVSSKDFKQNYNCYYRQSLDDDLPNGVYQGMLPNYYFCNGRLVNDNEILLQELHEYNQNTEYNSSLTFSLILISISIFSLLFFKKFISSYFKFSSTS